MTDDLHPTDGARFLFERRGDPAVDARAEYGAAIYTPTERFAYTATLEAGGEVTLDADGAPAPGDLEKKLRTIAKIAARDATRNAVDGLPPWPHRILRWRGPK